MTMEAPPPAATAADAVAAAIRAQAVPMDRPLDTADRMSGGFTLHHEHTGEEPHSVGGQFSYMLTTQDQPYTRRLKVGEEAMPLDTGWVESPGWIVLQNRTGMGLPVQPTAEQKAAIDAAVCVLALDGSDTGITMPPGRPQPVELEDPSRWRLRCRSGVASITITVFPR